MSLPAPAPYRIVTGILLAGLFSMPPAALAAPVFATYRVHVGGVAVLDVEATLSVTDRAYDVTVQARTGGFIGRMFPWETRSQSLGSLDQDGLKPTRHTQVSTFREKPRNVSLAYDAQGNVTASVSPPPEEDDREPVTDSQRRATFDPLSSVLSVLVAAARGEGCARTVPVFDGRRRYDMMLRDSGLRAVAPSRYSIYAGPARECRVTYQPVAGYNRRPNSSSWLRSDGQRDGGPPERPPVDLWIAPLVPDAPPLPVRVETDSAFGGVVIHLTGITPPLQRAAVP